MPPFINASPTSIANEIHKWMILSDYSSREARNNTIKNLSPDTRIHHWIMKSPPSEANKTYKGASRAKYFAKLLPAWLSAVSISFCPEFLDHYNINELIFTHLPFISNSLYQYITSIIARRSAENIFLYYIIARKSGEYLYIIGPSRNNKSASTLSWKILGLKCLSFNYHHVSKK